ncbi:MAG: hypothetical protein WBX25_00810, partial [Rhodomicrobium sp.]
SRETGSGLFLCKNPGLASVQAQQQSIFVYGTDTEQAAPAEQKKAAAPDHFSNDFINLDF